MRANVLQFLPKKLANTTNPTTLRNALAQSEKSRQQLAKRHSELKAVTDAPATVKDGMRDAAIVAGSTVSVGLLRGFTKGRSQRLELVGSGLGILGSFLADSPDGLVASVSFGSRAWSEVLEARTASFVQGIRERATDAAEQRDAEQTERKRAAA